MLDHGPHRLGRQLLGLRRRCLPLPLAPAVGAGADGVGDELAGEVVAVYVHHAPLPVHPALAADVPVGHAVAVPLEAHEAVEGDLPARAQVPLDLGRDLERPGVRRARRLVLAHRDACRRAPPAASLLGAPEGGLPVEGVKVGKGPSREEVPLHEADEPLHLALRIGVARPAQPGAVLASIYFSPVSLNRRTVRAKAVSPVALTYFHRFRSRLDGPVPRQVLQPVGPAGYLDQVAVVAHPVRDRARRHVVPEHPAPAADPHVGGDDRRALLVARRYQLEQQVRARAADVEVAELVDDQQPRVGVVLEPLLEDAARRGVLQVLDEPGAVHEPDLAPRPDGLDAQRDGEVRLAHAGAPHEQDVLGPLDEPQGRELLDLGARDRRLEVPVEVRQPLDVGEPRRPYALVGDPDLPGGDLDARHLLEGGGEAPLARGDHPHVVGQGRRHLVQPERGEVRLRPDRGAALRDGAHHAPPSESSSARLARAASAMSASARPRFPSRACP